MDGDRGVNAPTQIVARHVGHIAPCSSTCQVNQLWIAREPETNKLLTRSSDDSGPFASETKKHKIWDRARQVGNGRKLHDFVYGFLISLRTFVHVRRRQESQNWIPPGWRCASDCKTNKNQCTEIRGKKWVIFHTSMANEVPSRSVIGNSSTQETMQASCRYSQFWSCIIMQPVVEARAETMVNVWLSMNSFVSSEIAEKTQTFPSPPSVRPRDFQILVSQNSKGQFSTQISSNFDTLSQVPNVILCQKTKTSKTC